MSVPRNDDAQRDLEQHALRNVRGLVDRMERNDRIDSRNQWKTVAWIVAAILVLLMALLAPALTSKSSRAVEIPATKPGQVMPQAPRAPQ